jgi:hypothetical protein
MRENRALRESQYAERRARDWEETLRRGLELHRSRHEQYQAQAAAEMAAWHEAQQARAAAKAAKHQAMCEGLAWQLVQLAERAVEYRERTGELVPRGEWRRWLAMFKADDPQLGDPVVRGEVRRGGREGGSGAGTTARNASARTAQCERWVHRGVHDGCASWLCLAGVDHHWPRP